MVIGIVIHHKASKQEGHNSSKSNYSQDKSKEGLGLGLDNGRHLGVSAQEVQEVFPEAVATRPIDEYLTVKYEKLVPVLIEAIKELKAEIDTLKDVTNLE